MSKMMITFPFTAHHSVGETQAVMARMRRGTPEFEEATSGFDPLGDLGTTFDFCVHETFPNDAVAQDWAEGVRARARAVCKDADVVPGTIKITLLEDENA